MSHSSRHRRVLFAVLVVVGAVLGAWWMKGSPQAIHRSAVSTSSSGGEPVVVQRVLRATSADELEWMDGDAAKEAYEAAKVAVLADPGEWEAHRTISTANGTAHEQPFPYVYANNGARPEVTIPPGNTMWGVRIMAPNGELLDAYLTSPIAATQ